MTEQQKKQVVEALRRNAELLDAVVRFMRTNGVAAEYTVHYDEAECDGACLADDCRIAIDETDAALAILAQQEQPERTACECRKALKKILLWSQMEHTCGGDEGPCLPCNITNTAFNALASCPRPRP